MEKQFAGKRFTVQVVMTIEVDVYDDTRLYEAIEHLYIALDRDKRDGEEQEIHAHLMNDEILDWNVTNATDLYWEDVE